MGMIIYKEFGIDFGLYNCGRVLENNCDVSIID